MAIQGELFSNNNGFHNGPAHAWRESLVRNLDHLDRRDVLVPAPPSPISIQNRSCGGQPHFRKQTQPVATPERKIQKQTEWILVIDDVDIMRSILNRMLRRQGYNVVDAPNLEAAYRDFKNLSVRILILDLIIPNCEVTSSFSNTLQCFPTANAIAMSGGGRCGSNNLLSVAKQLGAAATLPKPFATRELLDLVEQLWDY